LSKCYLLPCFSGDEYSVGLLDHYGYEDFPGENGLSQLVVNTTNDFMQYYYNQQMFVKELVSVKLGNECVPCDA
jgi:myosin heavy subunit